MHIKLSQTIRSIAPATLLLLLLGFANVDTHADDAELTQATFYVY